MRKITMKTNNNTLGIIISLLLVTTGSYSGDVKIYSDRIPSAEEMGTVLFANNNKSVSGVRGRSINFAKKESVVIPVQHETSSSTEDDNSVGLPIEFAYNSAEIAPQSAKFMEEIGKMLTMEQYRNEKLRIEGHTDAKGSDTYNLYLSEKRAEAVKNYLIKHYHIEPSKLDAAGMGEKKALPGTDPYAPVNRRVQLYKG